MNTFGIILVLLGSPLTILCILTGLRDLAVIMGVITIMVASTVVWPTATEVKAFFDGHPTPQTKSASTPAHTWLKPTTTVTKPATSPYEIQLHNGKAYIVQNGQIKQLPIPASGNATIVLKP